MALSFKKSYSRTLIVSVSTLYLILFSTSCSEDPVSANQPDQPVTRDIPADAIPGITYLGTGYDAFGEYASTRAVMAPVIGLTSYTDVNALGNSYKIPQDVTFLNVSNFNYESNYGRFVSEYLSNRRQSVTLSASYGGFFSSTVKTNFTEEKYTSNDYAFCTVTRSIQLWRLSLPYTDIDKLRSMMLPTAREDINNLDPVLLFKKYGTHLTTEIDIGARADYHTEIEKNLETLEIKTEIVATAEASFKKASGSAEYDASFDEKVSLFNVNSTRKIRVSGGSSELALQISEEGKFNQWLETITENPVLCDFTRNSLIPIWDLCDTDARRQELLIALADYAGTKELPPIVKTNIADIKVISIGTGNYEPYVDFGYTIIPRDLNYEAGGNYIYFQYKEEPEGGEAIDSIGFVVKGQDGFIPPGWVKLPQDLNAGAGGADIFLCYKKAAQPVNPIRRLMVTLNNEVIPPDFETGKNLGWNSPQDLAQGTGNGVYIYLSYSREQPLGDSWGD